MDEPAVEMSCASQSKREVAAAEDGEHRRSGRGRSGHRTSMQPSMAHIDWAPRFRRSRDGPLGPSLVARRPTVMPSRSRRASLRSSCVVAVDRAVAAVAAERAVRGDDPVARDDQR